jgi:enterochelin esterase-like enzyme
VTHAVVLGSAILAVVLTCGSGVDSVRAEVIENTIPAPALEGSLLDVPANQLVAVYLPPSYGTGDRRYPVVYFLPGFGEPVPYFARFGVFQGFVLGPSVDRLIAAGTIREMIVVIPNGVTVMGGSFYANSPVSGDWEDFIVQDLVGHVDRTYRTIPRADARGIAGHSMGGTGALHLGLRHPEVFAAIYALSPGLFDSTGLADSPLFSDRHTIDQVLKDREELRRVSGDAARCRLIAFASDLSFIRHSFEEELTFAYGSAFAPDPDGPSPFFEYPYTRSDTTLVRDDRIWKQWEAGFGDLPAKLAANEGHLRQLKAIAIDYGEKEEFAWIPRGCRYLARLLRARGVEPTVLSFPGGHDDQVKSRLEESMLPFLSQQLASE